MVWYGNHNAYEGVCGLVVMITVVAADSHIGK